MNTDKKAVKIRETRVRPCPKGLVAIKTALRDNNAFDHLWLRPGSHHFPYKTLMLSERRTAQTGSGER